MGIHPLAVVGHVGPDFSGKAMDGAQRTGGSRRVGAGNAALRSFA